MTMKLRRVLSLSFVIAGSACGGSDSSSQSDGTTSATSASVTTDPMSTGTASTPGTSSPETTSDTPTTAMDSSTTITSSTTLASTSTSGDATSGESTAAESTGAVEPAPLAEHCACMLENCHDQYHAMWGEDHVQSEMMCLADAGAQPTVGMPAMSGNSIECRYDACTKKDCVGATGGGVCM